MRRSAAATLLALFALNGIPGCRGNTDFQKYYRNEYLVNGHIVVKGSDFGPPSQVAFKAALSDSLSNHQISPGFSRELQDFGQFYCSVKSTWRKDHKEEWTADLVQIATSRFHAYAQPQKADEVVHLDVTAAIAEK